MAAPEICFLTATEMAGRLRAREFSAVELMDDHLAMIERVNPQVNAIVTLVAEQAKAHARLADAKLARGDNIGPLHGLPIAHKDFTQTAGVRTTFGSPIFADFVPDQDALPIERLKGAGGITVGKTNTPEFAAGSQTYNDVFGTTRNPMTRRRHAAAAAAVRRRHSPAAWCRLPTGPTWGARYATRRASATSSASGPPQVEFPHGPH